MPPAIGAILTTVITVGVQYAASVGIISSLTATLITIGLTIATTLLFRPGKRQNQGAEIRMKLDSSMPRQVAVGLTATGGSLVWSYVQDVGGDVPNKFLYRVIGLSDFPITNCVRVMEGPDTLSFTGDFHAGEVACTRHLSKKGQARMWLRVYRGSFTPTADANLVSVTGGQWTSSHKGVGQAYAIVKYEYDPDAFPNGEPQLTFVLEGAPLYDDRKDGSKPSRTGTHRLNDIATWEYTTNAAVITAQYLRGFYVNDQLIVGVQAEERDLPDAYLTAAYNICDEVVDTLAGTAPRYQAGRMLTASEEAADILTDLQMAMDGRIYDRSGNIVIFPGATRTPVLDLTDDDIVWTEEKHWQPISSQSELYNYLSGSYVDGASNFDGVPYPPASNPTWEAADGGERFARSVDFRAVPFLPQVQRIVGRKFADSRNQEVIGFVGPLWLLELEQGDWFTLTSTRWGMTEKIFRVEFASILLESLQVTIIARETSSNIDDWDPDTQEIPPSGDVYIPPAAELAPPNFTVDPYLDEGPTGDVSGLLVTVTDDLSNTGIRIFESQIAYTADLDTVWSGPSIDVDSGSVIIPLTPAVDYSIRLRANASSDYSEWSSWIAETTPTVTNPIGGDAYVLKAGGTMTGALVLSGAPTIDLHASTKKYVDDQMGISPITTVTGALTLTSAHHTVLADAAGGAFQITLPTAAAQNKRSYKIKRINTTNNVTVKGDGTELIDSANTYVLTAQWDSITIQSDGTQWFIL